MCADIPEYPREPEYPTPQRPDEPGYPHEPGTPGHPDEPATRPEDEPSTPEPDRPEFPAEAFFARVHDRGVALAYRGAQRLRRSSDGL